MLKLLLLVAVLASTTIEANLVTKSLDVVFPSESTYNPLEHLRRPRDVEDFDLEETTQTPVVKENLSKYKIFFERIYATKKLHVLSIFMEEASRTNNNITVIGWQRVVGDDGQVEEIRSIQMVIPPKPKDASAPTNIVKLKRRDDEERLPHDKIDDTNRRLKDLDGRGMSGTLTLEKFDEDGKNVRLVCVQKEQLYAFDEGKYSVYNRTPVVATAEEVVDFVKSLKPSVLGKTSVLKFDVDGHLLVKQSHITPHVLGRVKESYQASDRILQDSPKIIAQISQQYPQEEIPKQLALHYNKAYPVYKWNVLVDPDYHYVTRDVYVTLTYDNFDFDENSDISYLVYGVIK